MQTFQFLITQIIEIVFSFFVKFGRFFTKIFVLCFIDGYEKVHSEENIYAFIFFGLC